VPAASSTTAERPPREPLVARLAGRRSDGDPRPRLEAILDRWRLEAGQDKLAIDVAGLASARGIRVVEAATGDWEGRVFVDSGRRLTIEVDRDHASARRRFTIAHELAHTAFPGFVADRRYRVDEDLGSAVFARNRSEEERLCDWGAGVLLMPEELIWSYRADQGLRAIEKLARDADVSLEAAANRLIERSRKPAVFLVLDDVEGRGLCVRYAKVQDLSLFVPRGIQVFEDSVFARAARSGARERDTGRLPSRSRRQFHIEAKSYPVGRGAGARERVLALAFPRGAERQA
jgi:Zn-dependent peptidase ImmA (M78 family)